MTEAALAPLQRAQQLAGGAATAAVVGAILIALAAVAKGASPALEALAEQQVTFDLAGILAALRALALFWVLALPSFFLAGALLDLSKVLDEYGKGQFFTLKASAGVRKAAEGALWALGFKIVGSPTIYAWITQEGRGFEWHMEPFDLGLVGFAAFVAVLGRVLEAAARIKAENDEIV
ncbi:MAG: DUF2975 domain-containing protein [Hyphomonadaceae bacterium]|jgi:hypothetical protein|nr:DUF2975 domain-containing protein [Hyphomonadaceae bacterium]